MSRRLQGTRIVGALVSVCVVLALMSATGVAAYAYATQSIAVHPVKVHTHGKKVVYLTFDDGPLPGYTNQVLADLNAAGAHATFFEVGANMVGNERLIAQLIDDGNVVGDHSETHPNFATQPQSWAATYSEMAGPAKWLKQHLGYKATMFRYPYGASSQMGNEILWTLGLTPEWWNIEAADWKPGVTNRQINAYIMKNVRPGFVIGLHDAAIGFATLRGGHPGYLPALLNELKAAGYSFGVLKAGQHHPRTVVGGE